MTDSEAATPAGSSTLAISPDRFQNLRTWNIGLTVLHAAQAVLILVLVE